MTRESRPSDQLPLAVRAKRLLTAPFRPPVSIGVRVLAADDQGRVMLVRHTYTPGWHLPGGGVDPGETAAEAAVRELREEAGLIAGAAPELFGLYTRLLRRGADHVAVYAVAHWQHAGSFPRGFEIAERGFFAPDALPDHTTPATARRLAEWRGAAPRADRW